MITAREPRRPLAQEWLWFGLSARNLIPGLCKLTRVSLIETIGSHRVQTVIPTPIIGAIASNRALSGLLET